MVIITILIQKLFFGSPWWYFDIRDVVDVLFPFIYLSDGDLAFNCLCYQGYKTTKLILA